MHRNILLLLVLLALCAAGYSAQSPSEPDLALWRAESSYLKSMAAWYKVDPVVIISIGQGTRDPLDVHVNLFLAKAAGENPMALHALRMKSGTTWVEVIRSRGINPSILFTPSGASPSANFARVYGQQRKLARAPGYKMVLYDQDVRNLVALKFCVKALGMTQRDVFGRCGKGMSLQSIIQDRLARGRMLQSRPGGYIREVIVKYHVRREDYVTAGRDE